MIFPCEEERTLASTGEAPARFLARLFGAMTAAADPGRLLPKVLPDRPRGRTIVVGAGKAAAAMAKAVEESWPGELTGLVVTRYGHGLPCRVIEVVEAGHPLPDARGLAAAKRILESVGGLSSEDLVVVLLSGGGSSLLTLPAPGLTVADLRRTNEQLLASGAPIAEINCVRKHLSALTGGRLAAAAWPAQVVTLAISDVPGDDPAVIASGPTVGDPSTFADALQVVERYGLRLPPRVRRHLHQALDETPKPGDPRLARSRLVLVATPALALQAAAAAAEASGVRPVLLGAEVQGESRVVAADHAALLGRLSNESVVGAPTDKVQPSSPSPTGKPFVLLSGGETTVAVKAHGRGGRNTEYLLALALALDSDDRSGRPVYGLAADTDGIDGTEDNAGAFLYPDTMARARAADLDPAGLLANNDSYGFFAVLGDLFVTGPTRTNVNDFRAVLLL